MSASSPTDKFLRYRGELRAMIGEGETLTFVTAHPEDQPTAVFRLATEKWELTSEPLPCGGSALVTDGTTLWIAGTDGKLYAGPVGGGAVTPLKKLGPLDPPPRVMTLVGDDALAVISGQRLIIAARKDGAERQRLELPEEGRALACDPSGTFLVAGTAKGRVVVFDREDKESFLAGEQAVVHNGPVTLLRFEPEELRVLTAGADGKLQTVHVRGALEPEDRSGSGAHKASVEALVDHPDGDLSYTGGRDGELKVWTRGQKRPKSFSSKDGVGRAVAGALVEVKGRPHLALACDDQTIRLFLLDAAGKVSHRAVVIHDGYAWARRGLNEAAKQPEREQVLGVLAEWADSPAVDLLGERANYDPTVTLRVEATELLGRCGHPRAVGHLEGLLTHSSEKVRLAALAGLRQVEGEASLRPLELALQARKPDVGTAAVEALGELAPSDDQAQARLVAALNDDPREVRFEALMQLERLSGDDDPQAELTALATSSWADLRWAAVLRCFQRGLLDRRPVLSALRRHGEDGDGRVRQAAFLAAVLSRPRLAAVLRALDAELHRQLHGFETHGQEVDPEAKLPKPKKASAKSLEPDDLTPLLEALASRALDTCLRGAHGLARLGDPRAFGTLLQLSREDDASARVEACQALEHLGDPRGLSRLRLMLRDGEAEVRDAAFTALSRLEAADPLEAADAGLLADHDDVRRRALKLLGRQLKKSLPKDMNHRAYQLLERALNDASASVRTEAFKATLNLGVGGAADAALRFARRSIHEDVRREVLTEVMGQVEQGWAWELVLEFFDDPSPKLRREAFDFARKKAKGRALEPLERALRSTAADIRLAAATALSTKVKDDTLPLLIEALDDDDREVRLEAIGALEAAEATDALTEVLASEHADVKVRAAKACAAFGQAEALAPLLEQVGEPEPEVEELRALWRQRVMIALDGLSALGSAEAVEPVRPLLDHDVAELRGAAARALAWCVPADDPALLRTLLQHDCSRVKHAAALGLAWLGDPLGSSLLFPGGDTSSGGAKKKASHKKVASAGVAAPVFSDESLVAAMTLGAEDLFLSALDTNNATLRLRAVRLLMLHEWRENDGVPDRCLATLSSSDPRVRLTGARALEHFHDLDAFGLFVIELLGDRGDHEKAWAFEAADVTALADAVVHGAPRLRVRAAELVAALEMEKRRDFDRAWRRFSTRFEGELEALAKAAKKRKAAKPTYSAEELASIVFGAYVGLSRQAGAWSTVRIRQSALARLRAMVESGRAGLDETAPALVQALGDPQSAARVQAFEMLRELGFDPARLSAEALGTRQRDVGTLGLKLLSEGQKGGAAVLEEVLQTNNDGLEYEAAKLLAEQVGWVEVHQKSLEASSQALRLQGVRGLSQLWDEEKAAQKALKQALESRYRAVRDQAAVELAHKRSEVAFEPLVRMLGEDRVGEQVQAINGLVALGEPKAIDALLDRVDNDRAGSAQLPNIFNAVASFRDPSRVARLFDMLAQKRLRAPAWNALVTISGDHQWLGVDWEHPEDRTWLEGQHPRHDEVLARLLEEGKALGEWRWLRQRVPGACWSESAEVGQALTALADTTDQPLRHQVIEALGWRLRHRDSSAEPLITALGHADPTTQLLAAEALALAGRAEGLNILLAAVEMVDDLRLRRRAVAALGELAHERSLDLLLRLVNEPGHALRDEAAKALGHMRETDKGEEIFKLLASLSQFDGSIGEAALEGLRHFGGHEAWTVIRRRGILPAPAIIRQKVAALLRHDDTDQGRELLQRMIIEDTDFLTVNAAAQSLRALEGPDSLEPDYILVQSPMGQLESDTVERLRDRGEPARLIAVLPKIPAGNREHFFEPLVTSLLARDPAPVAEAAERLGEADPRVVAVAARLIGHEAKKAAKKHGKAVVKATHRLSVEWTELFSGLAEASTQRASQLRQRLEDVGYGLRWLLWCCGRLGVGGDELVAAATIGRSAPEGRELRRTALTALAEGVGGDEGLAALEASAVGPDAGLRTLASAGLAQLDRARAGALSEQMLDDRASLDRLLAGDQSDQALGALRSAATSVHRQGVALPHLIGRGDVEGLAAAAGDRKLPEAARLGAIEGLSALRAEEPILAVARDEEEEEGLRKAAWRALRRARRAARKQGEVSR